MDMGEASREVVRTRLGALGAALEPVAETEKTGHARKFAAA
jgi:hypothetical protein